MTDGPTQSGAGAPVAGAVRLVRPPSQPSPARGEGFAAAENADGVDWAEVRRAYELSGETVGAIQERFGLTRYGLAKRRTDEGWTARPQVAGPALLPRRGSVGSEAIQYRLNRLLTTGVSMLEKRVAEEGMTETNACTLRELCRAQEIMMRATRNEKAAKAREKKNNDAGQDHRDDPEWLIAEIDRRLGRLAAKDKGGGAEAAAGADRKGAWSGDA
jgi:hypothetical protein